MIDLFQLEFAMAMSLVNVFHVVGAFSAPEYQQQALNSENTKLFLILFFIAFAFAVIATAVVVLVWQILKTRDKVMTIVTDLHGKSLPIIEKATTLINDLTPKVQDITSNVQHISFVARNKVEEFEPTISAANLTVKDANAKTHEQIVRVNEMITNVLNSTNEIVDKVDAGIKAPFREVSGVWAGMKAGVDTLINGKHHRTPGATRPAHTEPATPYVQRTATPAHAAAAAAEAAFAKAERQKSEL